MKYWVGKRRKIKKISNFKSPKSTHPQDPIKHLLFWQPLNQSTQVKKIQKRQNSINRKQTKEVLATTQTLTQKDPKKEVFSPNRIALQKKSKKQFYNQPLMFRDQYFLEFVNQDLLWGHHKAFKKQFRMLIFQVQAQELRRLKHLVSKIR